MKDLWGSSVDGEQYQVGVSAVEAAGGEAGVGGGLLLGLVAQKFSQVLM